MSEYYFLLPVSLENLLLSHLILKDREWILRISRLVVSPKLISTTLMKSGGFVWLFGVKLGEKGAGSSIEY